ncbi:hypothetical protein UVI_02059120 [Ustilaginoidea virens]|uniref:Uncharacterized protein n=1 Tax=Ustilaginoidea virens TaxID=1159556 RepID=A0A1B5L7Z4_USTVR|nr:hypothetical protein UVI_02059120 [Ustilaginoidea virens]
MSEEETRELIARQRSALYGEGPFADKNSYVDESGHIRTGVPGPSGPSSLRGPSPLAFDAIGRAPSAADAATPGSASERNATPGAPSPRPQSTSSPQSAGPVPTNKAFENAVGAQNRTTTSSPTGGSSPRDLAPGSKPGQNGASVAPIGTRPAGGKSTARFGKQKPPAQRGFSAPSRWERSDEFCISFHLMASLAGRGAISHADLGTVPTVKHIRLDVYSVASSWYMESGNEEDGAKQPGAPRELSDRTRSMAMQAMHGTCFF